MTFILACMPQTETTMSTLPQTGAMMSTTPQRSAMMSPTVSSPPGFPSTPQYGGRQCQLQQYHNSPHLPVSLYEDGRGMMSPITANTLQLSSVFHNADITPNLVTERLALFECDADGDIEVDPNGNNTFYLSEGYLYQSGHGRMKCQLTCLDSMDVPNNCGFHQQFYFLVHFKPCGPRCQGGFCPCLRRYPDY